MSRVYVCSIDGPVLSRYMFPIGRAAPPLPVHGRKPAAKSRLLRLSHLRVRRRAPLAVRLGAHSALQHRAHRLSARDAGGIWPPVFRRHAVFLRQRPALVEAVIESRLLQLYDLLWRSEGWAGTLEAVEAGLRWWREA